MFYPHSFAVYIRTMSNTANFLSRFGGISRALSNRNYRIYWLGQVVMVQGFWIYKIASGWLMWELTHSPSWLGALGSAYLLPVFLLGPFGGAVADRFGFRRCAITMGGLGAILALMIAALTWMNVITPALLILLTTLQGLFFAFEFPARQSLFPNLVPRKDMPAAVAMNATTFYSSGFTGPLIAGIILASFASHGVAIAFLANAFTMFWMMAAIYFIPVPPNLHERLAAKKESGILNDLKAGLKYTRSHSNIRLLIALAFTGALLIRIYLDFLPGFAGDIFKNGKEGLASLTAAAGIGSMMFASILAVRGRTAGLTTFLVLGQIGAAIALILFAQVDDFILGLAAMVFVGGLLVMGSTSAQSLIQHSVDDAYRARVISIHISLVVGAPAVSALIVGWIAEIVGLQIALTGSALLALALSLPLGIFLLKRRKSIEAEKG